MSFGEALSAGDEIARVSGIGQVHVPMHISTHRGARSNATASLVAVGGVSISTVGVSPHSRAAWRDIVKTVSLIAASVLALGWGAARADTLTPEPTAVPLATTPPTNVEVAAPQVNVEVNDHPIATPAPPGTGRVWNAAPTSTRGCRGQAVACSWEAGSRTSRTSASGE